MSFVPAMEAISQFYDVTWYDYDELLKQDLQQDRGEQMSHPWKHYRFVFVYGKWCGKLDLFVRSQVSFFE